VFRRSCNYKSQTGHTISGSFHVLNQRRTFFNEITGITIETSQGLGLIGTKVFGYCHLKRSAIFALLALVEKKQQFR